MTRHTMIKLAMLHSGYEVRVSGEWHHVAHVCIDGDTTFVHTTTGKVLRGAHDSEASARRCEAIGQSGTQHHRVTNDNATDASHGDIFRSK